MSPGTHTTDRAKLGDLLRLAHEQVTAIERGDKKAFDLILTAKRRLIGSFTDARGMVASDPALRIIVIEIQECDQAAQRLIYRKIGRIMRELSEIQQAKKARHAYHNAKKATPRRAYPFQQDTPRFFDRQF